MLIRLLCAATLAAVFALPAVASAHHGGSGTVGPTRVGDLKMDVSTQADVRAFAGEPDLVEPSPANERITQLGYHCDERDVCRTTYEVWTESDALAGFATVSKQFRTRRGTRVGHTRKRAERNERRKADHNVCGGGTRAILRERDDHYMYILFDRRRVFEIVVEGTFLYC
jgi:hypothetical protein